MIIYVVDFIFFDEIPRRASVLAFLLSDRICTEVRDKFDDCILYASCMNGLNALYSPSVTGRIASRTFG